MVMVRTCTHTNGHGHAHAASQHNASLNFLFDFFLWGCMGRHFFAFNINFVLRLWRNKSVLVNAQNAAYLRRWRRRRLVLLCTSIADSSRELPSRPRELLRPHDRCELRHIVRSPVRWSGIVTSLFLGRGLRHEFPRCGAPGNAAAAIMPCGAVFIQRRLVFIIRGTFANTDVCRRSLLESLR